MRSLRGVVACGVVSFLVMSAAAVAQVCPDERELTGISDDAVETIVARLLSGVSWAIGSVLQTQATTALDPFTPSFYVPNVGIILQYNGPRSPEEIRNLTVNLGTTMHIVGPVASQFFWDDKRLAIQVADLGYFIWNRDELSVGKEAPFREYRAWEKPVVFWLRKIGYELERISPEKTTTFNAFYAPGVGAGIWLASFGSESAMRNWSCDEWKSYFVSALGRNLDVILRDVLGENETLTFFTKMHDRTGELYFVAPRNSLADPETWVTYRRRPFSGE